VHHLVLSQYTRLTDGQTDGRTDRQNCDSNTVRCITCPTVKTQLYGKSFNVDILKTEFLFIDLKPQVARIDTFSRVTSHSARNLGHMIIWCVSFIKTVKTCVEYWRWRPSKQKTKQKQKNVLKQQKNTAQKHVLYLYLHSLYLIKTRNSRGDERPERDIGMRYSFR